MPQSSPTDISVYRVLPHAAGWEADLSWFLVQYLAALEEENSSNKLLSWRKTDPQHVGELKHSLEELLSLPEESCLLMASLSGEKVGYFLGMVKHCLAEIPSKIGYLNGLYVLPQFRRQGIAKRIYQEGLNWFNKMRLPSVELYVADGNLSGIHFWESLGYAMSERVLVKSLQQ